MFSGCRPSVFAQAEWLLRRLKGDQVRAENHRGMNICSKGELMLTVDESNAPTRLGGPWISQPSASMPYTFKPASNQPACAENAWPPRAWLVTPPRVDGMGVMSAVVEPRPDEIGERKDMRHFEKPWAGGLFLLGFEPSEWSLHGRTSQKKDKKDRAFFLLFLTTFLRFLF